MSAAWPGDAGALDAEQRRIALLQPLPWSVPVGGLVVAGCFLAFARGQEGPGHPGDLGWVGAVVLAVPGFSVLDDVAVPSVAGAAYDPGRLALREGASLAEGVERLSVRPDVLLVDATGFDHPRGAGLALHLGAVLDLPTVGVTHRTLLARGRQPGRARGQASPLEIDGRIVGAWVRTQTDVRPLAVHAGWRVGVDDAVRLVLTCTTSARTPEPLRRARVVARTTRAEAEHRR